VAVGEAELKARLAAAQTELAELLVEYGRVTSVAQSLGREKSALEKQLEAIAGRPADLPPVPPVPTVPAPEFTAKLERLQNALDDARAENARLTAAIESAQRDRLAFDERLATAAALLQRERTNFQERLAAAESKVIVDRAPVAATNFPDPAVEPLRAQVAQLTRDTAALRAEKEQMQSHLAELTARLAAAKAAPAPTAPAASRNAAVASGALPVVGDVRIAQLIADNARLNDEVRRSIIQLSAMNHQLRAAQVKAGQATATVPAEPASGNAP
jgi:DNA repair exonuclease SbcCD ATPase subunit